jgi:hypothetical protein
MEGSNRVQLALLDCVSDSRLLGMEEDHKPNKANARYGVPPPVICDVGRRKDNGKTKGNRVP